MTVTLKVDRIAYLFVVVCENAFVFVQFGELADARQACRQRKFRRENHGRY